MQLEGIKLPLEAVTPATIFTCLRVRPYYKYENGEKTETILGYVYTVGDPEQFQTLDIKIQGPAAITPERLQSEENSAELKVRFQRAVGKIYRKRDGSYDISFSAEAVLLVQQ